MSALLFADYWQKEMVTENMRDLGRMLGTYWTREEMEASRPENKIKRSSKPPSELLTPLTMVMNPNIEDYVRKSFGRAKGIDAPNWVEQDDMVDLFDSSQEDFMQFFASRIAPMAGQRK